MTSQNYVQEFGEGRRRRKRRLHWLVAGGGVYLLSLGFLYLLLNTSLFRAKSIEISTNSSQISGEDVLALLRSRVTATSWGNRLLGANHLLVWPETFTRDDLRLLPSIKRVEVKKDYGQKTIALNVVEREPYGIWCFEVRSPSLCLWFDEEGIPFKQGFSTEGNLIRVVRDYSKAGPEDAVLPQEFVGNMLSILKILEVSGLSIQEIALRNISLEEVEAHTVNGPTILFSLRFPPEGTLEVVNSLRERGGFHSLQYIDFRVEHRAYYK